MRNLIIIARSKGIIVSSGTNEPQHLRSPADMINFLSLFQISTKNVTATMRENVIHALSVGTARRLEKGVLFITEQKGKKRPTDSADKINKQQK
ncbi:MAG: hypothetical protein EZS28_041413 [Streblomastix strix]|uniref:Uncharacterized protein n=1 Tax=Streblomastix strix TaxID=222440 RepID=A0A5J4TY93_9EUKA|nr:MAG: hypothetical protein EZS28_041413 [Streblomastix strix]